MHGEGPEMLNERWGAYTYSTSRFHVEISWGPLECEAVRSFTARRDNTLKLKSTPHGEAAYLGDLPAFAESFETLRAMVDEAVAKMAQQPRHPSGVVFPVLRVGETTDEFHHELRVAAQTLLSLLEAEAETLAILYGYVNPLLLPHFSDSHWGGDMSGIRLPDDPHVYSLTAELGRLDFTRHDAATGRVPERIDIRSWDVVPSVVGDIQICRQQIDLSPLRREIQELVRSLDAADDQAVTIQYGE